MCDGVRLDVWLDVACLARTRSQAKELCDSGKVEINGVRAKPNRALRVGDRVHLTVGAGVHRELVVERLAARHVARAEARTLYRDVTPPLTENEIELRRMQRFAPPPSPPRGAGRPEKRDRRRLERLRSR